jgi:EAL domain-containing protein (putative c-di-GMP-specific phosphodiesterase class I)
VTLPAFPPPASDPFVADLSEGAEAGVYLALLELIDEGLIITTDELIIDVNSAACTLLERDYRELVGQPLRKLFCSEAEFIASRGRLLVQGRRRSEETFCLPSGAACKLNVLCAPRLRPGIHALVLSPVPVSTSAAAVSGESARPDQASVAGSGFATHLDPGLSLQARPASRFVPGQWPHPSARELEQQLWQALEHDQLSICFQPLVDTRRRSCHGGEALLRWQHPEHGLLGFGQFRAALHDPQLIACLGDRVLEEACAAASQWSQRDGRVLRLAVNVATEQLLLDGFAAALAKLLARVGLEPARLELDLDESVLESENAAIAAAIASLAALGVQLAVDDFGRGLSSIPRLRRYPLRTLKLDPALVAGVGHCEDSEASVEAIACMGSSLGLSIVARGVTTAAQRDFLAALGCRLQQGPLYGPPLAPSVFATQALDGLQPVPGVL